ITIPGAVLTESKPHWKKVDFSLHAGGQFLPQMKELGRFSHIVCDCCLIGVNFSSTKGRALFINMGIFPV
ncbi:hypothetical protein GOODEAATRI_018345, partial [Goodea atripinnis]